MTGSDRMLFRVGSLCLAPFSSFPFPVSAVYCVGGLNPPAATRNTYDRARRACSWEHRSRTRRLSSHASGSCCPDLAPFLPFLTCCPSQPPFFFHFFSSFPFPLPPPLPPLLPFFVFRLYPVLHSLDSARIPPKWTGLDRLSAGPLLAEVAVVVVAVAAVVVVSNKPFSLAFLMCVGCAVGDGRCLWGTI
ncbi:uncharacterized protein J3D65DRAFT_120978 [Phyllosticta citribraziliensis]|uniref:Uncharacterized protein n=1 Tax=Phyllosticta citribraziliensis TaxID=989973 RepID=A0ABR1LAH4_9PEZI